MNQTKTYDPITGEGAIGVEFAGTAVTSTSPFGAGIAPGPADAISRTLVASNTDLQWSEGSYRGFFTLEVTPSTVTATYYAMQNVSAYPVPPTTGSRRSRMHADRLHGRCV